MVKWDGLDSEACGHSCPAPGGSSRAGSVKQHLNHLFTALFFRLLLYAGLHQSGGLQCELLG